MVDRPSPPASDPPTGDADDQDDHDDDGLLDHIGDFIDEALGEHLEPTPTPEDPWERRQRRLDAWTAVLLGLAAFATAWATYQSTQWSDRQQDFEAEATILYSIAGQVTTDASQAEMVDTQMWLRWVEAVDEGRVSRAEFLRDRFSPQLTAAVGAWLSDIPDDAELGPATLPDGTPMDLPEYEVELRVTETILTATADLRRDDANEASNRAREYVLLAVVLAMVLLLGSIATKFTSPKIQVWLILASVVLLLYSAVRSIQLDTLW